MDEKINIERSVLKPSKAENMNTVGIEKLYSFKDVIQLRGFEHQPHQPSLIDSSYTGNQFGSDTLIVRF